MAHLGQTIADLRQERHLSQVELAADILSPAQLSKAEHGLTDLSATKLVLLLGRLHITPREFFSLAEIQTDQEQEEYQIIIEIKQAMFKQSRELAQQAWQHAENYHRRVQSEFSRLTLILVRTQMIQLDKQKLAAADRQFLLDYLFSVEHWSQYELILFMTAVDSLGHELTNALAHELVQRANQYQQLNFSFLVNLLYNVLLINLGISAEESCFYVTALNKLDYGSSRMDAQFVRQFGNALYQYIYQDKVVAKKRIDELLQILQSLQMTDYHRVFKDNFFEVTHLSYRE